MTRTIAQRGDRLLDRGRNRRGRPIELTEYDYTAANVFGKVYHATGFEVRGPALGIYPYPCPAMPDRGSALSAARADFEAQAVFP